MSALAYFASPVALISIRSNDTRGAPELLVFTNQNPCLIFLPPPRWVAHTMAGAGVLQNLNI